MQGPATQLRHTNTAGPNTRSMMTSSPTNTTHELIATNATTAGGDTPTLLINGWAGCAADWGSLVDRLGGSGRRVVAFDPRGFGASGDGAAASVRTLSEDLCGNQNFTARSC